EQLEADGGRLAAETLRRHDVDTLFTLSGGHLFPLYDGCVKTGIRLVDTRHEQTATFAAEGWAKVTRRPGAAALTAGPGVTNGVSAITSASLNGSPMLVVGGRAPHARWGSGSLQELDHLPIVASITKQAATVTAPDQIPALVDSALRAARTPHRGPTFVDVPLDAWGVASATVPDSPRPGALAGDAPDPDAIAAVAKLVGEADRPVLMVGADVFWAGGEDALRALAEAARLPVFANGLGRGLLPADHELAFSRVRSTAFGQADLVVVAGAPLDFRLGFGRFGDARVVHLADSAAGVARSVELAASASGELTRVLTGLADVTPAPSPSRNRDAWVTRLRDEERERRAAEVPDLESDASPVRPTRVYGELRRRLDRDAIVIGDGGDFVSYAGKYVDSYQPGGFLDPGPYGCLGTGSGYALAAALAHPGRQVVVMWGDGALGFSLGDLDTLVRFGADVVGIVGNNGIWGLEKHPMQLIYGYDVVAELRPGTRYDEVMTALGGHGELVSEPGEIGPALDRAFATPGPSLVNVLTDPADAYPRSSNLA
ncbi:MAG TPA: acetolactate synthase, partial [Acidimicrobiia bacterium]|nr:acetolactate synthase [Acidimicrobiia bacterium]